MGFLSSRSGKEQNIAGAGGAECKHVPHPKNGAGRPWAELNLRPGVGMGVSFPRVPGIEAAGIVDAAPAGSGLAPGQKVVAMMRDMGRTYDGGYAEYTSVPLSQVISVDTDLPWEVLGGLPEMMQAACGSLTIGLDLKPGQSVLIGGGTSSVGLAAAALATWRGRGGPAGLPP
jgi:NADPH:quinone reductase